MISPVLIVTIPRFVILGNHRDAWTFGAVDPNSGTAALLEVIIITLHSHTCYLSMLPSVEFACNVGCPKTLEVTKKWLETTTNNYSVQLGC